MLVCKYVKVENGDPVPGNSLARVILVRQSSVVRLALYRGEIWLAMVSRSARNERQPKDTPRIEPSSETLNYVSDLVDALRSTTAFENRCVLEPTGIEITSSAK